MTTIRKLAQLAGVSIGTVSRALRDDPRLRAETCARIQELAALHQYRPNRLTQRLISGKSQTIGIILPTVTSTFHARILRGVLEEAFASSFHVIPVETHNQLLKTRAAIHALIEQRVEGLLIASEHYAGIPREAVLELWGQGVVPIGIDATRFDSPIDQVRTDEEQLAAMAVDYLLGLGHRDIAYLGPLPAGRLIDRALAVHHALQRKGLSTAYFLDTLTDDYLQFDAGAVLARLLALPVTAVIAWEDRIAAKLLQQAADDAVEIPRALSVLGCANFDIAELSRPRLTTIEQFPEEMGRQAVKLLLRRLADGPDRDHRHTETLAIQPRLIPRASCAPPGG